MSNPRVRAATDASNLGVACQNCNLFQLCLPLAAGGPDLELLDQIAKRRRALQRGHYRFRAGEPFVFVYAVKSGSVKTATPVEGSSDQVIGFHLPGELLGLDAIDSEVHQCNAQALEATSVCAVPLSRLEELGSVVTSAQRPMLRIMGKQILHDQRLQTLL